MEETQEEKSKFSFTKIKENPWMLSTFALALIVAIFLGFLIANYASKSTVTGNAIAFINEELLQGQGQVALEEVNEKAGLYEVIVEYNGEMIPTYFSKDGEYFINGQVIPISEITSSVETEQETQEIVKSDKPEVDLFIWSYCPYGVQAQGPMAEVASLLKEKVDFKAYLYYDGHGDYETQQNKIQACIQKVSPDKYWDYAKGFVDDIYPNCGQSRDIGCDEEESIKLMDSLGINSDEVMDCVESEGEALIAEDSAKAQSSGVSGSPTIIINGVKVSVSRNAEAIKQAICSAFNEMPEECSEELSAGSGSASGSC